MFPVTTMRSFDTPSSNRFCAEDGVGAAQQKISLRPLVEAQLATVGRCTGRRDHVFVIEVFKVQLGGTQMLEPRSRERWNVSPGTHTYTPK